jgi:hypothetical protein
MKKLILVLGIIALFTTCATVAAGPDDLDMAIRDASASYGTSSRTEVAANKAGTGRGPTSAAAPCKTG